VLVLSALQQVALMSNTLVYPIILGRAAGLSPDQLLNFVSLAMLGLAMATILMCVRSRLIGCGYLCPAAYTQIYLGVSLSAVQLGGLPLMFGMTFLAGLMQLAIAPSLRRARALLPPEIAGLVIAITGLSLAIFGVRYSLGLQADNNIEPRALMVAAIVLITMVGLNVWTKAPLVISEQRPSPRTIMASEDGERLLAGYLLRRSADRISSRMSGDRAEIHLHYDH
jgi:xanthine permease XanP